MGPCRFSASADSVSYHRQPSPRRGLSGDRSEALIGLDRNLGSDKADLEKRIDVLHRLRDLHVVGERLWILGQC
jgi:hypothetical protein